MDEDPLHVARAVATNFEYDIFVSYAHADDTLPEGSSARFGWVTALVRNLNSGVNVLRKRIFIDHQLRPLDAFNEDLKAKVAHSALLLLLLSRNYVKSEWCGVELYHFLKARSDDPNRPRNVVMVELVPFENLEPAPPLLQCVRKELIHAQFWYRHENSGLDRVVGFPCPKDVAKSDYYWLQLHKLVQAIDDRLAELSLPRQAISWASVPAIVTGASRSTEIKPTLMETDTNIAGVFLADVTDDLVPERENMRAFLSNEKIRVLPEGDYYGKSGAELNDELGKHIDSSCLFVQLLSNSLGRTPSGARSRLPQLQFDVVSSKCIPIMQWRDPALDPRSVADPAHTALLNSRFVHANNIERFKQEVVAKFRALHATASDVNPHQAPGVIIAHRDDSSGLTQAGDTSKVNLTPYVGLRSFTEKESQLFFGRDAQVGRLLDKLATCRFLAVVGESGSGKSSLVRAGIIPALYGNALSKIAGSWNIITFKPGDTPLGNLACRLAEDERWRGTMPESEAAPYLAALLASSSAALIKLFDAVCYRFNGEAVLLIVDQFEEIFRFRQRNVDQAEAFVKLILRSSAEAGRPIYVAITMRADFLGRCAAFYELPDAINSGLYLTPRLDREQLRSVIEGPLQLVGGAIDPALTNILLNEITDEDELPVFQHKLFRMWCNAHEHGRKTLTYRDVEAVCCPLAAVADVNVTKGTTIEVFSANRGRAIDIHAEEIFLQLEPQQQNLAEELFLALTERRDGLDVRRPTRFIDLAIGLDARGRADVMSVIDAYRAEGVGFIIPPASELIDDETVIDITHESLIRHWRRLQDWLAHYTADLDELKDLQMLAARYATNRGDLLDSSEFTDFKSLITRLQGKILAGGRVLRHGDILSEVDNFMRESERALDEYSQACKDWENQKNQAYEDFLSPGGAYVSNRSIFDFEHGPIQRRR